MERRARALTRTTVAIGARILAAVIGLWAAWSSALGLIVDWPFLVLIACMAVLVFLQAGGLSGTVRSKLAVGFLVILATAYVTFYETRFETTALEIVRDAEFCVVTLRYPELACAG